MVNTIKEALIIKKYTDIEEHLQLFVNIPANTTVTTIYTPPPNYTFFIVYIVTGPQPYGKGKVTVVLDGTIYYADAISSKVLERKIPILPLNYIKHELQYKITNLDVVPHTVDAVGGGFLIPNAKLDSFLEEITGDKDRKELIEIKESLHRIEKSLGGVRRMRG